MNLKSEEVISDIKKGDIISFQTDTVYGLFARVNLKSKININKLKKRDLEQNLQIMFVDLEEAFSWLSLTQFQKKVLSNKLPGNDSFIVPINKNIDKSYLGDTLLIRIPKISNDTSLFETLDYFGALFATSANLHNERELNHCRKISKKFGVKCIKDNIKHSNNPSKIFSLLNDEIEAILR